MKKLIVSSILIISSIIFSGCSQKEPVKEVVIQKELIQKTPLGLTPQRVYLNDIRWTVLNVDGKIYYALDSKDYENLSVNTLSLYNFMKETNYILNQYKSYYETPDTK